MKAFNTDRDANAIANRSIRPALAVVLLLLAAPFATGQEPEPADPQLIKEAERLIEAADRLSVDGDAAEAIAAGEKAVELNRKLYGDAGRKTALAKSHLALSLSKSGDHQRSLELWEQALAVATKELGPDHPSSLTLLENVASALAELQQPAASAERYNQAIAVFKRKKQDSTFEAAELHTQLGVQQLAAGDSSAARASFEQAIALHRRIAGKDVLEMIRPTIQLGNALRSQGDNPAAMRKFQDALRLCLKFHGQNHVSTADTYNNIAVIHIERGDAPAAADALGKALAIRVEVLGYEHPDVAFSFENTAVLYVMRRNYQEAERLLKIALQIRRKHSDEQPYLHSNVLSNLAVIYHRIGQPEKAVEAIKEALEITSRTIGDSHSLTFVQWENLAQLQLNARDLDGAAESMDHVRRAIRNHISRALPGLTEREQVQFLTATYKQQLHHALSMGVRHSEHPGLRDGSAAWLINGKAVTHESLADREQLLKLSRAEGESEAVAKLLEMRRTLAALSMNIGRVASKHAKVPEIERLQEQELELSRQVAGDLHRPENFGRWIELATVREALPEGSLFIDLSRLDYYDFDNPNPELASERFQPPRYVAWIIPPAGHGDIQLVDLGLASELDPIVSKVRDEVFQASRTGGVIEKQGEEAAVARLASAMQNVRQRIWDPLSESVPEDVKSLVISPDGHLWLLPWSAIPVADERMLIEDYSLKFVTSGRNLVASQDAADVETSAPVMFADPDFDLTADSVQQSIQKLFPTRARDRSITRGRTGAASLGRMLRLPNTRAEADFIAPNVEKIAGTAPVAYTGQFALESVAKSVVRPELMVISTHGFFLAEKSDDPPEGSRTAASTTPSAPDQSAADNPLLRCGLMFAGCNSTQTTASDDGILTGLEIVGIDLVGTEMVVLSACETGVGRINNGEGVAGLRQAFQLAGAQSVIATLWQVPDRDSALLMNDFFANLAAGQHRAEALRQAQLARIQSRKERYGAAHPFFWAAWTVTGR